MDIQKILQNDFSHIENITERDYWFVRTDQGYYFETYYDNGFLAIGWNEITLNDIPNINVYGSAIRAKVRGNPDNAINKIEKLSSQEGKITGILNKNKAFYDLKKGDVVIMPSVGSQFLAFGVILDDKPYNGQGLDCSYNKRRKVNWLKYENAKNLDAKFAYVKKSFHAISKIDEQFHDVIDNFMFDSYIKDGFGNISLKIKLRDEINYAKLKMLLDNLIEIGRQYNKANGITEDLDQATIKLNLQSPGFVNLKNIGRSLIISSSVVLSACDSDDGHKAAADTFIQQNGIDSTLVENTIELLEDFEIEK
ncbi:MAG: hypothetical protein QNK23_02905 [Crocinitomicaceae bacterium]|nr:hypothetical protein [Crocinitomicaceae bacterium]